RSTASAITSCASRSSLRPDDVSAASDPLHDLSQRLSAAAASGFAAVADDATGAGLLAALDAVLARRDDAELSALRPRLAAFAEIGRHDRQVIVAHAMRVCAMLRAAAAERAGAAPARRRRARPEALEEVPRPRRGRSAARETAEAPAP